MFLKQRSLSFLMIYSLCQISLCAIPVYINFYAIDKLFYHRKYFLYSVCLVGTIIISAIFIDFFFMLVFNDTFSLNNYIFEITLIVIIATTIKVGINSIKQRLDLEKIKTKQLETELGLLKTQINPHFLFNTLNNLYGLAQRQEKEAADGIAQLSHLMRYMIYDSSVSKINLEKEIHQIEQIIKLQKLRFSKDDKISIDFQIEGDVNAVKIPPMLLISFVENAFKHGFSLREPSFLKIDLRIDESKLYFSVKNSIHSSRNHQNDLDSGIGLKNVRRRLELLYSDSHELNIRKEQNIFKIDLSLTL
jgi:LytS/YehU family sensor histidine kinase